MKRIKYSIEHLSMVEGVVKFALNSDTLSVTNLVPVFKSNILVLEEMVNQLNNLGSKRLVKITGYAANKRDLKFEVAEKSFIVMSTVYAFAVKTGNEVLQNQMKISKAALKVLPYEKLYDRAQEAIQFVSPIVSSLEGYNITKQTINDWQGSLNSLFKVLSAPKNAISNRVTINRQYQTLLREAVFFCKQILDPLSGMFGSIDKKYLNAYKNVRKLKMNTKQTRFKGKVVDELEQPVSEAVLVVEGRPELKVKTDMNGEAVLQVPPGVNSIVMTVEDKRQGTGPLKFVRGKTLKFTFVTGTMVGKLPAKEEVEEESRERERVWNSESED